MSISARPPEPALEQETLAEIERFRGALDLEQGFAFHVLIADTPGLLNAAIRSLPQPPTIIPLPPAAESVEETARGILERFDHAIKNAAAEPLLLNAMAAERDLAWEVVFQRLNRSRNGIEAQHPGLLLIALTPGGESLFGRSAPDFWSRRGSGMRLRDPHRPRSLAVASPALPAPPEDLRAFQNACLHVFRRLWNDPAVQPDARATQPDAGIDLFGRNQAGWAGVQCKVAEKQTMTVAELERAIRAARLFEPRLRTFILATTSLRNRKLQARAQELSAPDFLVQIWFWEDLAPYAEGVRN